MSFVWTVALTLLAFLIADIGSSNIPGDADNLHGYLANLCDGLGDDLFNPFQHCVFNSVLWNTGKLVDKYLTDCARGHGVTRIVISLACR